MSTSSVTGPSAERRRSTSTTARHSALPGLPFPGNPDAFPTKDAVADYLAAYAARFELPIRHGAGVTALTRADGLFSATTSSGVVQARAAVVATGPFQIPAVPALADDLDPAILQIGRAHV